MNDAPSRVIPDQATIVAELCASERVRELAGFLGLDAEAVAEGLVEAVQRDLGRQLPSLAPRWEP